MVGHGLREQNLDLCAQGCETKAIDEGVVGFVVRAQEEAALGATAGDHVVGTWKDLAWKTHAYLSVRSQKKLLTNYPRFGCLRSVATIPADEVFARLEQRFGGK